jgi:hypothetical protein
METEPLIFQMLCLIAEHFNTAASDGNYNRKCDLNNDGAV